MNQELIEQGARLLLKGFGEDLNRPGIIETPKRVTKMYIEMLEGMHYTNEEIAKMYGKSFDVDTSQMVIVKDIEAFSLCEHHLALMYDMNISVGYIPKGKVIGLSKIPRIAELCCKRLQLQEKIGEDIAEVISLATGSDDVIVHIKSKHSCVTARGIKSRQSSTVTLTTKGAFKDNLGLIQQFKNDV
ncbi:GTP cyclohydrolase I [Veillonella caviae]|uniref:GTP cyclohydrolase I n=1 Tax=Veillonella caviae TaxID=248316 RepID=UPI0023F16577|nr:GTP cyclohydrolase I [Veillonella caviae]MCI6406986.1 GTP cyclohydrolase I [Veillonella caviae]MDY6224382.1 GTP cyclohydrolase I [Veillonella caviae]